MLKFLCVHTQNFMCVKLLKTVGKNALPFVYYMH